MVPTTNNLRIIKTKNMKFSKLFLAFFLGAFTVSAQTPMPDAAFENWCESLGYGDGVVGNDTISTSIAATVTDLPIDNVGISDLTGIEAFVNNEVAALPDRESQMNLLGENANTRIEAADLWAKKNLSESSYDALSNVATTADGVKAIEEIMALNKDAPIPSTETKIDVSPSKLDLRSMMNDERYWKDGAKDQAYIKKVTDLYQKYSSQ